MEAPWSKTRRSSFLHLTKTKINTSPTTRQYTPRCSCHRRLLTVTSLCVVCATGSKYLARKRHNLLPEWNVKRWGANLRMMLNEEGGMHQLCIAVHKGLNEKSKNSKTNPQNKAQSWTSYVLWWLLMCTCTVSEGWLVNATLFLAQSLCRQSFVHLSRNNYIRGPRILLWGPIFCCFIVITTNKFTL